MSDEEEDVAEFFISKRRRPRRPLSPPRVPSPPPVVESSSDETDSPIRRRRSKKPPPPKLALPAWTRPKPQNKKSGRSNLESRRSATAEPIIIVDSDEEPPPKSRIDLDLPPPPELSAAKKAELAKLTAQLLGIEQALVPPETTTVPSSDPPELEDAHSGETVMISVRMVADPARIAAGASAAAIRAYQKEKQFTVDRGGPLRALMKGLAQRVGKQPEDLVLVYKKSKIKSLQLRPVDLGIDSYGEMTGYEKDVWEKIQQEEKAARRRHLAELDGQTEDPEPASTSPSNPSTTIDPLPEPTAGPSKTRLTLRGKEGQYLVAVEPNVSANVLCRFYCKKAGRPMEDGAGMRLEFEGEQISPDEAIEELDLEDGDLLDVVEI